MRVLTRITSLLGGIVVVGGVLAAQGCGDSDSATTSGGTTTSATTSDTTSSSSGTGGTGGSSTSSTGGSTSSTGGAGGGAADCATYCDSITAHCTGDSAQYPDTATCMAVCGDWSHGAMTGNTVECHAYHASVANNDEHCTHSGIWGAGQCGDPCSNFCELAEKECPDAYGTVADCATACMGYTEGTYSFGKPELMTNSLACRAYHLVVAVNTPDPHCAHVGETTMNQCGP